MICRKCGSVLPPDAVFCGNCGALADVETDNTENAGYAGYADSTGGNEYVFCWNCGAKRSPDGFCPQCGAPAEPEQGYAVPQSSGQPAYRSVNAYGVEKKPNKNNTPILVAVIAALVAVIAALAVTAGFLWYKSNSKSSNLFGDEKTAETVKSTAAAATPAPTATVTPTPSPDAQAAVPDAQAAVPPAPANAAAPPPQNNPPAQNNSQYLYPSDSSYITTAYLNTLSREQVRLILNEMYAKHGYIFTVDAYKQYFSSKPWYVPVYTSADTAESFFNDYERANKTTIVNYEAAKGWR